MLITSRGSAIGHDFNFLYLSESYFHFYGGRVVR